MTSNTQNHQPAMGNVIELVAHPVYQRRLEAQALAVVRRRNLHLVATTMDAWVHDCPQFPYPLMRRKGTACDYCGATEHPPKGAA
jgi:hypothetical protein